MALAEQIKKGGPYTKKEQEERRSEVFRLHFEYGYSARKISQLMNINRNTINRDVSFCYAKLRNDYHKDDFNDWLNKQLFRLELQRARFRQELDYEITLQEKLQVEKMILEIDSKITNLILKLKNSYHEDIELAVEYINKWMKKTGSEFRYMSHGSLHRLSEKSRDKICKILENPL